MKLFNTIFSSILDTFYIEIDQLAVDIDRHPSRIRHWKTDSVPSRYIIDNLSNALLKQLSDTNDSLKSKIFIKDSLQLLESSEYVSSEYIEALKAESQFEPFLRMLIYLCHSHDNSKKTVESNMAQIKEQVNLAKALETSGEFESAENIYKELLTTHQKHLSPQTRSEIHSNLGLINFLYLQSYGDSAYYEKAIACYEVSLKELDSKKFPESYAILLKKLGSVYNFQSELHNTQYNINKALACYNQALDYIKLTNNTLERLRILHNIALAYTHLAKIVDPLINIEKSIHLFELIFESNLSEDPQLKALCEMNMGLTFFNKIEIKFSIESAKKGLELSENALTYFTVERNPLYFSIINCTIGGIYASLASISTSKFNNQQAVAAFKKVLWVYADHKEQRILCLTHNNLATTYLALFFETEDPNYLKDAKRSIDAFTEFMDFQVFDALIMSYYTLLGVYRSALFKVGTLSNPKEVTDAFDLILSNNEANAYMNALGSALYNKCSALLRMYDTSGHKKYLQQSIEHKKQLFNVNNLLSYPISYAQSNMLFGDIYRHLYELDGKESDKHFAFEHYEKALALFNKKDYTEKYDLLQNKLSQLS